MEELALSWFLLDQQRQRREEEEQRDRERKRQEDESRRRVGPPNAMPFYPAWETCNTMCYSVNPFTMPDDLLPFAEEIQE